jgi:hypothetical protein
MTDSTPGWVLKRKFSKVAARHPRLHALTHATWCRVIGTVDHRRVATTGTTTGGGGGGTTSFLLEVFNLTGNTIFKQSFDTLAEAQAYLNSHYQVVGGSGVGAAGTYAIYDSKSAIVAHGFIGQQGGGGGGGGGPGIYNVVGTDPQGRPWKGQLTVGPNSTLQAALDNLRALGFTNLVATPA